MQGMPPSLGISALFQAQVKKEQMEKIHEGRRKARIVSESPSNKGGWPRAGFQAYKYRYFLCLPDPDTSMSRFMLKSHVRNELVMTEGQKLIDNNFVP
jgi:hypothetical protein